MPKFLLKRWHGYHIVLTLVFCVILIGLLSFEHWVYGVFGLVMLAFLVYYLFSAEKAFQAEFIDYVDTLSYRVKKAGAEAIQRLPVGIIVYDEHRRIEWHNPYISQFVCEDSLIGKEISDCFPGLPRRETGETRIEFHHGDRIVVADIEPEERLMFLTDVTEWRGLEQRYEDEQIVFGIIHLDNLEDATQEMDDQSRIVLQTNVTSAISDWAREHDILLRRYDDDKFFTIFHRKTLEVLERKRFDILDVVRELTADHKIPITLSIGVGSSTGSLFERAREAQGSLDVALGRGGDQAAVKKGGRMTFYGGKTNAVEKRTRVRARVISHALKNLIQESENVLIMGHTSPDMDSVGAAIGVWKAAQLQKKEAYIVIEDDCPAIENLLAEIEEHEYLGDYFISTDEALAVCKRRTLVVVVDTHRPSITMAPQLLKASERVVVIDHHRRGEEFVEDPVLVYIEPYASSTCELVAELLQYQTEQLAMDPLEATALLAGIVVDTKSFAFRSGSRTFEAASFLRRHGADLALIQLLLKEDLSRFVKRAEIVKNAETVFDRLAVAVGEKDKAYDQFLIAQAADTLLNMNGIEAAFVIAERTDGLIGISARSLGDVNVQVVMEQLGGGGHMTNAAVQLEGVTIDEAKQALLTVLEELEGKEEDDE